MFEVHDRLCAEYANSSNFLKTAQNRGQFLHYFNKGLFKKNTFQ